MLLPRKTRQKEVDLNRNSRNILFRTAWSQMCFLHGENSNTGEGGRTLCSLSCVALKGGAVIIYLTLKHAWCGCWPFWSLSALSAMFRRFRERGLSRLRSDAQRRQYQCAAGQSASRRDQCHCHSTHNT